jgi:hypothetical protein
VGVSSVHLRDTLLGNRVFLRVTDALIFDVLQCSLWPPIQWAQVAISRGVKRLGSEADHPPPSYAEVKNGEAIPPLPHMSSWHSA